MLIGVTALFAFAIASFCSPLPPLSFLFAALILLLALYLLNSQDLLNPQCVITAKSRPISDSRLWLLILILLVICLMRAVTWGQAQLDNRVAQEFESREVVVEGYVASLPDNEAVIKGRQLQRFNFSVSAAYLPESESESERQINFPKKIRLTYYSSQLGVTQPLSVAPILSAAQPLKGGQGWRLLVKVKRPHGFSNPGGFDYELWLTSRGIGAVGYVRALISPLETNSLRARIDRWREWIRAEFLRSGTGAQSVSRVEGVALALTIGDKSLISATDSQIIREAGLSHLLAISGLHVTLVAGLGFLIGRCIGAALGLVVPLYSYGPRVGVLCSLLFAGGYTALSGFGIPAQRAFIMLLVWSIWFLSNRYYSPWVSWWLSMTAVLWLQPLALMEAGFWLSFAAVASLIFLSAQTVSRSWGWLRTVLFVQCGLFLLLSAVQLFWGLGANPWSPLINLVAIPYVSFLVIPVLLLAVASMLLFGLPAEAVKSLGYWLIEQFWLRLDELRELGLLLYFLPLHPMTWFEMVSALCGAVFLFAPVATLLRIVGGGILLFVVCRLIFSDPATHTAHSKLTVLDVGQGLSVLMESQNQTLLYDTGPYFSAGFDSGRAVVVPLLKSLGISQLDYMIVSHNDSDHSGGYRSIDKEIKSKQKYFGEEIDVWLGLPNNFNNLSCDESRSWQMAGVRVSIIGLNQSRGGQEEKANNQSCVVLLEGADWRVLLPGDVETSREQVLLQHPLLQKPVDILLASHHGSKTSSSESWVKQLQPRWVVFSAGYKNRYGHPHGDVVSRYRKVGSQLLCSFDSGAITFSFREGGVEVERYRQRVARYWRETAATSCHSL